MNIPVGRILRTDMGDDKWGGVLYLVANPPIICETCHAAVIDWRSSSGDVVCPECGNVITHRDYCPCPHCGGNDYHTFRVVNNSNWHYDSTNDEVTPYNDKAGKVMNLCGKMILDDIKFQRMVLMTHNESQCIKRKIVWTSSDSYDPEVPMPQSIIDMFPYE